jgi:hypothetical protein
MATVSYWEQLNAPADPANQAPLAPIKSSLLRKLFIGTDGLRAGWSLLIFIALMAVLLRGLSAIANFLHLLPKRVPLTRTHKPRIESRSGTIRSPDSWYCLAKPYPGNDEWNALRTTPFDYQPNMLSWHVQFPGFVVG